MRIISLLLAAIFFQETMASSTDAPQIFKHHTFEFSVTPTVDYHFITYPGRLSGYKQQINNLYLPFVGCNFGLSYLYRPIKFVALSTGINYLEYDYNMGKVDPSLEFVQGRPVISIVKFNGTIQNGYIGVPILLHGFYSVKKIELDFATGPEFSFPIYTIANFTAKSDSAGVFDVNSRNTKLYSPTAMRQQSYFGWDVQLTASIPVKNSFSVSIGPEINFIGVHPLEPGAGYSTDIPHQINYYTGVKVCFRLASNFPKKTSTSNN